MIKASEWKRWFTITILLIGSIFLLYFLYLSIAYGPFYITFSWTFLVMGILLLTYGYYEYTHQRHILSMLPLLPRRFFYLVITLALVFFIFLQGSIIMQGGQTSKQQANYVIVLGAQLNGSSISRLLRYRLEAAVTYAEEYPQATLIVSGGKGPGESISEASAMKSYLIEHGVKEERILLEDASGNTQENFRYSKELLNNTHDTKISIITNSFHMARSQLICEKQGLSCTTYPAKSDLDLAPVFYFREFFGYVKDAFLSR